jgi:hypothetical protein
MAARRARRALRAFAGVAVAAALWGSVPAARALPVWDVGQVDQPGQWTIYNRAQGGAEVGFPLAAGDMNGDGLADLVLTPMNADSGPNRDRVGSGEAVILLSQGTIVGERNLATLDVSALPPDVMVVYGADMFDYFGTQVTVADVDGDGYGDAIVGTQYGDGANNARANSGEVAIIWGGPGLGGRVLDLAAPPPGAVTFVYGANAGDRLGAWVSSGDVDGDGIADAVLGADEANPGGKHHAGQTYVLYGGAVLRTLAAVDLAAPAVPVTVISGIDPGDHSGATVRAYDLNHDGAADVLIGAGLERLSAQIGPTGNLDGEGSGGGDGPNNVCDPVHLACEIGEAYIVYGQRGQRPAAIDLANPPPSTTFIYGIGRGDVWGEELYAGDFNGDGWGDVAIGALTADGPDNGIVGLDPTGDNSRANSGEAALILGGPTLEGSVIELTNPPPNVTFFWGARPGAIAGDTIMLLDVDGDGKDELVIACPDDKAQGRVDAGDTFVFFGTTDPLPRAIDLAAIPDGLSVLEIDGAESNDMLAYSMGRGDVNGDGRPDMVLNAMGGDGYMNLLPEAGDAYVLDAAAVAHAVGRALVPTGTPTETPTPTPSLTATPTRPPCVGDCNGDGRVTIDELILGVRIALGATPVSACTAVDANGNGTVEIAELVAAVMRILAGC